MEKIVGQANLVGKIRHRQNRIGDLKLPHPRTSRIYYGLTVSGNLQAMPAAEAKGIVISDYPHLEKSAAALLGIDVSSIHKKTTTPGYRLRDTGNRIEKTGGFGSHHEKRKVKKLRKEKELKRNLLKANINAGQLSLMIYSAFHSQTLHEIPPAKKPSPKKGGFMSSKEVRLMQKQKKKNEKAFAHHGNIYKY